MSNSFIKSSPLDGLQNNLTSSSSIISFDSILTNSRLLDKLDLSNDDEFLLLEQMKKENNNFDYSDNTKVTGAHNTVSTYMEGRATQLNRRIPSYNNPNQGLNAERLISMPASQFPSLRTTSNPSSNNNFINTTNVKQRLHPPSNEVSLNSTNTTSIKNILNDVTFKDKSIQSKVEQHYSNTSRFSYIVEEDTNSVHNRIIENFSDKEVNPFLRRNQNLSTKSNTSTNTQFSKISYQLSTPITQATTQSDTLITTSDFSDTPSPTSSPLNDKKPNPTFLKSHKKKNSLTSLKNLFKNNKSKNSSDASSKKSGSSEALTNEGVDSLKSPSHPITYSSSKGNSTIQRNKSSSKLIFSPQPNLYPNNQTVLSTNNNNYNNSNNQHYQNIHTNYKHNSNHNNQHSHHFQSNDVASTINNSICNNTNLLKHNRKHSHPKIENDTVLPDPSHLLNKTNIAPVRPPHQRSYSAFNTSTAPGSTTQSATSKNSTTSTSNPSSTTNLAAKYYRPHPSKPNKTAASVPTRNNTYSSHSRNKSLQEEDLISTAIDMRKAGNLHASALRLRQACQKGNKTAFLLYGLALRYGYGIDTDYIQSFYYIKLSTAIKLWDDEVFNTSINPFQLEQNLSESIPSKLEEPLVPALYECGIAYLKGFGAPEIDEFKGLKCLEKAASMGHVDSMCLSGIIWSQDQEIGKAALKSNFPSGGGLRKKDVAKAAAWFRIADKRGANLIGSDWIYKDKYLKAADSR